VIASVAQYRTAFYSNNDRCETSTGKLLISGAYLMKITLAGMI